MKKKFIFLLFLLVFCFAGFYFWQTRSKQASKLLSKATGLELSLNSLEPFFWGAEIKDLEVANPPKSKKQRALHVHSFSLSFVPSSFFGDTLQIKELTLEGVDLDIDLYDIKGKKSNWKELFKEKKEEQKASDANKSANKRKVLIENVDLKNLTLRIKHPLLGKSKHHIEHIHLSNVDQEASLLKVVEFVVKAVISQAGNKLPNVENLIKQGVQMPANAIKGILPGSSKEEERSLKIEDLPGRLFDGAKKLLPSKSDS